MWDSLKEHIENSREEFEVYPFDSDQEWGKLSKKIKPVSNRNPWKITGIAACLALILMGSVLFFSSEEKPVNQVAELENFYSGEINHKISLIKNHLGDDKILKDLQEMDAVFGELKDDLKDNVDNEEVIMAMMENYRLKLQILEEILNELEKEQSEEVL
ncbi:hypothetical protein SAMN05421640_0605 [Ekhidna lutea]|uniref:Anti-sigma factor n=1 Tax=Ekhidna lutea TaxID=447679 RepID=A0A239FEN1_EKHLU|nr:hypothetical protein [Ekhidna lutea]SNS54544.1 hypothetical protein SAMN05421640_0605 [Ekhidna lutea]